MNKKELTRKLMERMQKFGYFPSFTNVKIFIREYEKMTKPEPQKPVVPQFVADWYEIHKDSFEPDLFACIRDILNDGCVANISEFEHWILGRKDSITTLVNMHQFGYTVEKEKRYLVKIKGINDNICYLNHSKDNQWNINDEIEYPNIRTKHTRKELEEAGFGEVFNSPLFEVEEVEE